MFCFESYLFESLGVFAARKKYEMILFPSNNQGVMIVGLVTLRTMVESDGNDLNPGRMREIKTLKNRLSYHSGTVYYIH